MGAPLYSDSRVSQELGVVTDAMLDYSKSFNVGLDVALRVTRQMRDEYEARIAELEGELAEQWTPVDDDWSYNSEEHLSLRVTHGGGTLRATDYAVYGSPVPLVNDHHLPDHIRLCSKPKEQAE